LLAVLSILVSRKWLAASPASLAESVSWYVTSHARGLPHVTGIESWCRSDVYRFAGDYWLYWAYWLFDDMLHIARQIMSMRGLWRYCLGALLLHVKP